MGKNRKYEPALNDDCFCIFGQGGKGKGHPTAREYIDHMLGRDKTGYDKEKERLLF